ncbi:protein of unknown function [Methylacidimicrobium sp. AP8]|nr:protein of unknown function [Methylacidimicrobium sp. AP8]
MVSIAFRHLILSRPCVRADPVAVEWLSLHCLSASHPFPTQGAGGHEMAGEDAVSIAFRHLILSRRTSGVC